MKFIQNIYVLFTIVINKKKCRTWKVFVSSFRNHVIIEAILATKNTSSDCCASSYFITSVAQSIKRPHTSILTFYPHTIIASYIKKIMSRNNKGKTNITQHISYYFIKLIF